MTPVHRVVFATTVFGLGENGPETYARYLWEAFRDDPQIEFHLVAPEFSGAHPRWHASGKGRGSLDLYRRNAQTALQVAGDLGAGGGNVVLHVNSSHLHSSLLAYRGPLWGQVNDYENTDVWRRGLEIVRRAGPRRFLALWRRRHLEQRFIARQDLSLCNSDYTRERILAEYRPAHPERIITLHKAVDISFFQRPASLPRDPLERPPAARRLVFVGSDFIRKGLDVLLRAVAQLPAGMDWHLTVVGVGRAEAERVFPELGEKIMGARVLFAGRLEKEQLRSVLWHSHLFVLPSRAEAFGVAVLEALAAGLPVVASRVGGIPEIMRHPDAGILTPPDDAPALARALVELQPWPQGLPPPVVRALLGQFSAQVMTARLRELYLRTNGNFAIPARN
jgi:glycosyltransferase involved in cell wall biosynthesis